MRTLQAIGFDLFNTLITVEANALHIAVGRLVGSLTENGFPIDETRFNKAHREAAIRFIAETRVTGRETHNRFWISAALQAVGFEVDPDDPRIAQAITAYFSAFHESARLIPGTAEMLSELRRRYRLGLLSNFTHGPAAWKIIDSLGLTEHFDTILISGELGYRKPHPLVFERLMEELGVEARDLIYIGDDPEPDIEGPCQVGIQPVWTTYVWDRNIPFAPGIATIKNYQPKREVPRISEWKDLLVLLQTDGTPGSCPPPESE